MDIRRNHRYVRVERGYQRGGEQHEEVAVCSRAGAAARVGRAELSRPRERRGAHPRSGKAGRGRR